MITLDPKVKAALEETHWKLETAGELWPRAKLDEIRACLRARFGFPIVERKGIAAYQEYRTKRVILEIYDAIQQAIETGRPYETRMDPPLADARAAHPRRATERVGKASPSARGPTA